MRSPTSPPLKNQLIRSLTGTTSDSKFISEIVNLGLEELGYAPISTKQLSPVLRVYAISQNQADFTANFWEKLNDQLFKQSNRDETLRQVGTVVSPALQGYQIDRKTAEKYKIKTLDQLRDPQICKAI
jgi:glycine betaine/proline transport system substrate-binding protein